jgi:hypothetical protein
MKRRLLSDNLTHVRSILRLAAPIKPDWYPQVHLASTAADCWQTMPTAQRLCEASIKIAETFDSYSKRPRDSKRKLSTQTHRNRTDSDATLAPRQGRYSSNRTQASLILPSRGASNIDRTAVTRRERDDHIKFSLCWPMARNSARGSRRSNRVLDCESDAGTQIAITECPWPI